MRGFPTKFATERSFWKAQLSNLIAAAGLELNLLHLTSLLNMHTSFQLTEEFSTHPTEPLKKRALILQRVIYIPSANVTFFFNHNLAKGSLLH